MIAAIIGAAASLGSAIYGAIKSSKANNNARKLIQQQRDENRRWYDKRRAEDYTMRSDVQAALKRQRELLAEQYENARRTNVVAGGTPEALALQQQAANRSVAQATTDIASNAAAYKDAVENQYRAQDAALNQQQAQSYQQQAAQTAQAAGQAVNAGVNLMGVDLANYKPTELGEIDPATGQPVKAGTGFQYAPPAPGRKPAVTPDNKSFA